MKFLFLGSAFQGVEKSVVGPLAMYAEHYGLTTIHLGPVATEDEIKMWRSRQQKLRTWEHAVSQFRDASSLGEAEVERIVEEAYLWLAERGIKQTDVVQWDSFAEDELEPADMKYLKLKLQMRINLSRVRMELDALEAAQAARIKVLKELFPKIKWVLSEEQAIQFNELVAGFGVNYLGTKFNIGKFDALSMPANTPKTAGAPITPRTIAALAASGNSAVMPHAIPMSDSRAKEGLNNARNYFTTGSLTARNEEISGTKDLYRGKHLPGGVVCVFDNDNNFYANNLLVEKGSNYFLAEDGLLFTATSVFNVDGGKCAVVLTDSHVPWQAKDVALAACEAAAEMNADTFIHNGDLDEGEGVNRHAQSSPGMLEGKRIINSLNAVEGFLGRLVDLSGCKKFVWTLGNHESWYTQFVEKHPVLKGLLDWKSLASRYSKWDIIQRDPGENRVFRFGDLVLRHGDQESLQSAIESFGKVMNGHWHRYYRMGQSGILGCSCELGPSYLDNNITAWQLQFATLTIGQGGKTQTSYKTVLRNGKGGSSYCFRNEIITIKGS